MSCRQTYSRLLSLGETGLKFGEIKEEKEEKMYNLVKDQEYMDYGGT